VLSLAHPKVAVVLKRPNSKKLEESHQFMINPKYRSQLKKVIIPLLKAVERDPEDKKAQKAIELQRRHQMDAAIVRIMKTRKKLRHNLLVAEVISQLQARFQPRYVSRILT
jgi:cullin 3